MKKAYRRTVCVMCKGKLKPHQKITCSIKCRNAARVTRTTRPCAWCKVVQIPYYPNRQEKYNQKYCSRECLAQAKMANPEYRKKLHNPEVTKKIQKSLKAFYSTEAGKAEAKKHSIRMSKTNPSHNQEIVEKIRQTKEKNGTLHIAPKNRGGNGQLTVPQKSLHTLLGEGWKMEFVVKTGIKRTWAKSPYPGHYKLDLALPELLLAIEVDGHTHSSKTALGVDRKKTEFLKSLGWTVLRFTNKEVMTNSLKVLSEIQKKIKDLS